MESTVLVTQNGTFLLFIEKGKDNECNRKFHARRTLQE